MSELRLLGPNDYRSMRWRNGGGVTAELASAPGAGGRFLWRVSIAEVAQSGPFSNFTGYDRIITLLSGEGMALDFSGAAEPVRIADRLAPVPFSGDWATTCRLFGGPVRDFNVMVDRERAAAKVTALGSIPRAEWRNADGDITLLYAIRGGFACHAEKSPIDRVPPGYSLLWTRDATAPVLRPGEDAEALLVEIFLRR
ncbi:MAG TPA: HutD family protein [Alphaproteobacteria bacterium]|nr:HutD family protein [Alphaproteobacteria bacterium]